MLSVENIRLFSISSSKTGTKPMKADMQVMDHYFWEQIPVHPPGLIVHPPLLTCTPPRGNLKFPLRITQLHTKFSRQFKGLHMILSNLSTVILHCLKELQYLHMKRCKQTCIRLNERGCCSTFTSLPSASCPCETSTSTSTSPLLHPLL